MNNIKDLWARSTRTPRQARAWLKRHPYFPSIPWSIGLFLLSFSVKDSPFWGPFAWLGMALAVLIGSLAINAIITIISGR